jgi:hypothetical protein
MREAQQTARSLIRLITGQGKETSRDIYHKGTQRITKERYERPDSQQPVALVDFLLRAALPPLHAQNPHTRQGPGVRRLWALYRFYRSTGTGCGPAGTRCGTPTARCSAWGQTPYPTSSGPSEHVGDRPRRRGQTSLFCIFFLLTFGRYPYNDVQFSEYLLDTKQIEEDL